MTRTEERLADALHARAGQVAEDRLRPLPAPEPRRARRPRAWLVPLAAAASVALIIGLAVAVTGASRHDYYGPAYQPGGAAAGMPRYFAQFVGQNPPGPSLQVRSTSTGSVVASAPFPKAPGWSLELNTVAASPDGRTFYVAYDAIQVRASLVHQIWIYRVHVGIAPPAPLIQINGTAALDTGGSMAVSPDGGKLALTADTTTQLDPNVPGWADKVIVIDLHSGAQTVWQGGLYRAGKVFTIPGISWTADGRSLVFLGLWCNPPAADNLCAGTSGQQGYRDTQVRSLDVAAGGGTLDRGRLLLTQSARYPVIAAAIAGPGASELTLVVLSGKPGPVGSWSRIAVERVSAAGGALLGVELRLAGGSGAGWRTDNVAISADPSGRYQLFSYGELSRAGWLDHGTLRYLPLDRPYPGTRVSAW